MRTSNYAVAGSIGAGSGQTGRTCAELQTLYIVTAAEITQLRHALLQGQLPVDFEEKLRRLERRSLMHQMIAHHCRIFAMLLAAAFTGLFKEAGPRECERLLWVLAYVRKDEDVIPDYRPNGFVDDLQEVRAAARDLGVLLHQFKAWRLCHQVPGMWLN